MIPEPHPEIAGSSVKLRKFDASQIHDRYIAWLNDPVVNKLSRRGFAAPVSTEDAKSYLEGLSADEIVLGIYEGQIGHVGNLKYGPVDWVNSRADISILIGEPAMWGSGVGKQAVYLVTRFLFDELGLNKVDAGSNNPAFLRLVENLGWSVEGVLRQRIRIADGYSDNTLVGLLSTEFERRPAFEQ